MSHRTAAMFAFCVWASSVVAGTAGQLPVYPAAKPGDAGYIAEDPQHAALVGTPAPSITLRSIDAGSIDISSSYGRKPVYLKLWATYCIPCRAQMPGFERLYETYGGRMQVVAVDAGLGEDVEQVRAFVKTANMRMPVAIDDGTLGSWLRMEATPFHLLIGRDGRIAYAGHQDGPALNAALERVLADSSVSTPVENTRLEPLKALRPGDVVPTIVLRDGSDRPVRLTPLTDRRPRAVLFTATWCETYLKDTEPETSDACRRAREQVDVLSQRSAVDWIAVMAHLWTTPQSLGAYQERVKQRVPLALDSEGQAFRLFGIRRLPAVALIGGDGRLLRVVGPDDGDLSTALGSLLPRQ